MLMALSCWSAKDDFGLQSILLTPGGYRWQDVGGGPKRGRTREIKRLARWDGEEAVYGTSKLSFMARGGKP